MTRAAHRSRAGFTLLETMVALAILGLVVVALLELATGATAATAKSRAYTQGMALAEQRMETLLAVPAEESLATDGDERAFAPPFDAFRARVAARRIADRELVEIRVAVSWDHAGGGRVDLATRKLADPRAAGAP